MKVYPRHTLRLSGKVILRAFSLFFKGDFKDDSKIEQFEAIFRNYIGANYSIGVSSARKGLYLALKAMNLPEGSEVIVPAYTFFALPMVITACKLKPIFVDIDSSTMNVDISDIKKALTINTRAIMLTHMFGQPCDMDSIMDIVKSNNLILIEDCAHSCGAKYKDKYVGSFGDIGIFSFNMGKNLPCFSGGMVTLRDESIYKSMKTYVKEMPFPSKIDVLKNIISTIVFYFITHKYVFPYITYPILLILSFFAGDFIDSAMEESCDILMVKNYLENQKRITSLQCDIGIIQMKHLDEMNFLSCTNAEYFSSKLKLINGIRIQKSLESTKPVYLYYRIGVSKKNLLRKRLLPKGVDTKRDDMSVCTSLDIFTRYYRHCPNAEALCDEDGVELPNSPFFKQSDLDYIIQKIENILIK